jgi:hypothetical protein
MAENKKNIVGFKKFTDLKSKPKIEEIDPSTGVAPDTDFDRPMNPNLPEETKKGERIASRKDILAFDQNISTDEEEDDFSDDIDLDDKTHESKVDFSGKVAKFPKNIKASKAYNFLENVKVSKKSIWYLMIEKQDNELQMVKYNVKEGVDLTKFVNELKSYYTKKYSNEPKLKKLIESISVDGNDKYSMVKNIPAVSVDGKKMITKITEDLIKLLSK